MIFQRKAGENRVPETGFGELPVAPPVVPQHVGGRSGPRKDSGGGSRCFSNRGRRGGGRGCGEGSAHRSEGGNSATGAVDRVGEQARAESPRHGGGGGAASPHGGGGDDDDAGKITKYTL